MFRSPLEDPDSTYVLVRNAARCDECGDVLESVDVHDFKQCTCGNIFVDGGLEYVRRGFKTGKWTELSEYIGETDNGNTDH